MTRIEFIESTLRDVGFAPIEVERISNGLVKIMKEDPHGEIQSLPGMTIEETLKIAKMDIFEACNAAVERHYPTQSFGA